MIRPRVGDFVYKQEELDVMSEDISAFAETGITGAVLGALEVNGTVDIQTTRKLVNKAIGKGLHGSYPAFLDK